MKNRIGLAAALIVGAVFRTFRFPDWPPGLNQDEISSAYESFSLLRTGADRWGNVFPVYFPSWGSGQNVLQSYLQIPFVAGLGLNASSVRILALLSGLGTLLLFYRAVRAEFGERAGLFAAWLIALTPWHIMLSRWGLESNLLPFVLLLGVRSLQSAFEPNAKARVVWASLVPFAFAYYAYGISAAIVPIFVILFAIANRDTIGARLKDWLIAAGVHAVLGAPFAIFLFLNHLLRLPSPNATHAFMIPVLETTRFEQINEGLVSRLAENMKFIAAGFNDGQVWNALPKQTPILWTSLAAGLIGLAVLTRNLGDGRFHARRMSWPLAWLIACLPLIIAIPLNVNRFNAFFLPWIAISAFGLDFLLSRVSRPAVKRVVAVAALLGVIYPVWVFSSEYFGHAGHLYRFLFNDGLGDAIRFADRESEGSLPVFVTDRLPIPYMHPAFHLAYDPAKFQAESNPVFDGVQYVVEGYGRFNFNPNTIPDLPRPFLTVTADKEILPCQQPEEIAKFERWVVSRCR